MIIFLFYFILQIYVYINPLTAASLYIVILLTTPLIYKYNLHIIVENEWIYRIILFCKADKMTIYKPADVKGLIHKKSYIIICLKQYILWVFFYSLIFRTRWQIKVSVNKCSSINESIINYRAINKTFSTNKPKYIFYLLIISE